MLREWAIPSAGLEGGSAAAPPKPPSRKPEEAQLPLRTRAFRAALVTLVWVVSSLPTAFGLQRCTIATLFHVPCPGCGMTRALRLFGAGDLHASFRMHPLALPILATGVLLIAATIWETFATGTPFLLHRGRFGRTAIALATLVYTLAAALWVLRWLGHFGGPVPID
jgi:hypothetical protein